MDINAAEATIDQLFRAGLVRDPADLYALGYEQLIQLDRFADKSARNLLESIERSREVPFTRVLYALGIRYVGETVAKILAVFFRSLEALMKAGKEELEEVDEIGERIALSVTGYLNDPLNLRLIARLKEAGLQFEMVQEQEQGRKTLEGLVFVISGVFEQHSRDELKEKIEQQGGKCTGSISQNTNYLLAGENMGPSKREKAKSLGIPVISEQDFLAMLR
jgi:DNA ligase (NAD+)